MNFFDFHRRVLFFFFTIFWWSMNISIIQKVMEAFDHLFLRLTNFELINHNPILIYFTTWQSTIPLINISSAPRKPFIKECFQIIWSQFRRRDSKFMIFYITFNDPCLPSMRIIHASFAIAVWTFTFLRFIVVRPCQ